MTQHFLTNLSHYEGEIKVLFYVTKETVVETKQEETLSKMYPGDNGRKRITVKAAN